MQVGAIGYNYSHDSDFIMSRPDGNGCWLMLFVKDNSIFKIGSETFKVRKNSVVVFSPEMPCIYRGDGGRYTDDWIFFTLENSEQEQFEQLGIPINKPFYLGRLGELSQLIRAMSFEHYSPDPNHAEIENLYAKILLLKLSDLIHSVQPRSQPLADKNYRLIHLRDSIYASPETIPDVSKLAEYAGMSRSGFQHLYSRIFGVSVKHDIVSSRINYAKRLLSSSELSIKEIAERCGYSSEFSFMRIFKEKTGKTPTQYRKNN